MAKAPVAVRRRKRTRNGNACYSFTYTHRNGKRYRKHQCTKRKGVVRNPTCSKKFKAKRYHCVFRRRLIRR